VLLGAYWASYIAVAGDPGGGWARFVSLFPATAPFAMPGRIALGAADWWEPVLAVVLALAAVAALVVGGRVYTGVASMLVGCARSSSPVVAPSMAQPCGAASLSPAGP
jgi:hypothetical protein